VAFPDAQDEPDDQFDFDQDAPEVEEVYPESDDSEDELEEDTSAQHHIAVPPKSASAKAQLAKRQKLQAPACPFHSVEEKMLFAQLTLDHGHDPDVLTARFNEKVMAESALGLDCTHYMQ
jgi:hypothetical protein